MRRQKRRFLEVDNDNLGTPGEGFGRHGDSACSRHGLPCNKPNRMARNIIRLQAIVSLSDDHDFYRFTLIDNVISKKKVPITLSTRNNNSAFYPKK